MRTRAVCVVLALFAFNVASLVGKNIGTNAWGTDPVVTVRGYVSMEGSDSATTPTINGVVPQYANDTCTTATYATTAGTTYYATTETLPTGGSLTVEHPTDEFPYKRAATPLFKSSDLTPTNWWRFEETSGTVAYPSAGTVNMAYSTSGALAIGSTGKFGCCPTVSGNISGSAMSAARSFVSNTAFTIDLWVNRSSSDSGTHCIYGVAGNTATAHFLALRSVNGVLTYYFGGMFCVPGGTLVAGEWTHLTCTWDGTLLKAYKNGVLTGSYTSTGTNQSTATYFFLSGSFLMYQMYGMYDNLMIFDTAIPQEAINSIDENFSYAGKWCPAPIGTEAGKVSVSYSSPTATTFVNNTSTTLQMAGTVRF
jgi:hypothetical protein